MYYNTNGNWKRLCVQGGINSGDIVQNYRVGVSEISKLWILYFLKHTSSLRIFLSVKFRKTTLIQGSVKIIKIQLPSVYKGVCIVFEGVKSLFYIHLTARHHEDCICKASWKMQHSAFSRYQMRIEGHTHRGFHKLVSQIKE